MTQESNNAGEQDDNSVSGYYEGYSDMQKEVLAIETRKTRNTLFTIAAVILVSDILSLLALNVFKLEVVLVVLIVPVAIAGLAFLANKEPLTAIIIAAVIIIGIWIYTIVVSGGRAAIMGWLIKAVIIYFLIAGFQHAREATRIKKELGI
jgi:hypothetical protein